MTHVERLENLIRVAGSIVYFHEMVELSKQRLEEPVDTQTKSVIGSGG